MSTSETRYPRSVRTGPTGLAARFIRSERGRGFVAFRHAAYRLIFTAFLIQQIGFWMSHVTLQGLVEERAADGDNLAARLRAAGYRTIHCGKAHWGAIGTDGSDPERLGFDVNIAGHSAGGPGSYQGEKNYGNERGEHTLPWGVPGLAEYHGTDTHLTDALTTKARSAVEGAVRDGKHRRSECLLCMDCTGFCPEERVSFGLRKTTGLDPGVDLERRGLLTSMACGAMMAPVVKIGPVTHEQNPYLVRPPGAVAEAEFLQRCVRCAECMKVCIGRALHPALLEAGPVGLWTPLVVSRIGYCEYNCTLCGQVCPTGAIERLDLPRKKKTVIGLAVFDKDRCLPFAKGIECLVCEEHCPTGEKAFF